MHCVYAMFLVLLLLFLAEVCGRSSVVVVASAAASSSSSSAAAASSSSTTASKDERKGILKDLKRVKGGRKQESSDGAEVSSGGSIYNAPIKTSKVFRNKQGSRRSLAGFGINTDLFLTEFNLQNLALSILSGGGVYIGFKISELLEDLYRKRVRKEKKLSMDDDGKSLSNGKMTGKKSSGVSVDMYNQLKKEQEELWRITHQLYSEVEKVGVVSNGTRQDLIGVLAQLADISSSISSSSSSSEKREEEKEGVGGGGGIDEDIASMKNDIDEHTEKIDTLIELISTLKEEEIPSMLKAKEKAIVERVSAYVKELKALVAKKETVQKTKSINSSDSSPPASSSSPGKKS
tara:strand:- start:222 stop:1265 length:1044 start_codon:yes stop_codon:yes gene_type:complete